MVGKYCDLLELTIRNMKSRSSASPFKRQSLPPDVAVTQYGQREGLPGERRGSWGALHEECPGFQKECQWSPLRRLGGGVGGGGETYCWGLDLGETLAQFTSGKRKRWEKRKEELEGRQESREGDRERRKKREAGLVRDYVQPQLLSIPSDA